ncbi:Ig-like domain-containing protein [Sulfurirhabdus autotrophica]|uniref:Big-1 domain-containing protein n=1 Tax=Sulfurirhabdus autotrophica TaxID=1706046 RepID=A0A4R3Y748_9PROT|nr:Ig-like domain-containing protein [Sulfurirhabdus autotrophica]TCV88105.1 hypothetical protein EDC63_10462 [Sulfurirhabdus autotrophica]
MLNTKIMKSTLMATTATLVLVGAALQPVQAQPQSSNVAYINSLTVSNGGSFPSNTTNAAFTAFNFFNLPYNTASYSTALGPGGVCGASACDTVFLNVASPSPFRCNVNGLLGTQQKTDLVSFVSNGGKLIIYDSECSTQNYSWLPYPFTTNNPGARGGRGTVNIVEDNALSTKVGDPSCTGGDPRCINATTLGANTDAVGDMNVMTSLDNNWCLDMSGTNSINQTGPTHTYARYGNGLIIYNGFDVDVLNVSTQPVNTVAAGNLSKIWLQELQVQFNPTPLQVNGVPYMPCGVAVVGITQAPLTAINDLASGQNSHTVTATLKNQSGAPQAGVTVSFVVQAGPNSGVSGTCSLNVNCTTDSNGQVSFTYASNGSLGIDTIHTCFTNQLQQQICAQDAKKEWIRTQLRVCDVDSDNDIDKDDLALISRSRGQSVPPGDPRDANGDGVITPADVKVCIPLCTRANCATQ